MCIGDTIQTQFWFLAENVEETAPPFDMDFSEFLDTLDFGNFIPSRLDFWLATRQNGDTTVFINLPMHQLDSITYTLQHISQLYSFCRGAIMDGVQLDVLISNSEDVNMEARVMSKHNKASRSIPTTTTTK